MKMKRTFPLTIILLLLFLLTALCAAAHAKPVGTFSRVEGRVDITSPGEPARPVARGDEVGIGDIIRAKSESKAEIAFVDGGILRIAPKSRVKIDRYLVEGDRTSSLFNLFRGKIETVVKKSGGLFGGRDANKQEVHTPTAVCGVRGTDFFSTYQKGISSFVFKEGHGYGYNKGRPDIVMDIHAGQAMVVLGSNVPPIVRAATAEEISRNSADTAVKDETGGDNDEKEDGQTDDGGDSGESGEGEAKGQQEGKTTSDEKGTGKGKSGDKGHDGGEAEGYGQWESAADASWSKSDNKNADKSNRGYHGKGSDVSSPDIPYDASDYTADFRIDTLSISGDSGSNTYDLTMSGVYNWDPPFIHLYEDIRGELAGDLHEGYFLGFTGAGWNKHESDVGGIAAFFYVAIDATGGLIIGDIAGHYYTNPNTWDASSAMEWVQLGAGLVVPDGADDIDEYVRTTSFVSGSGNFFDAASNDAGDINISAVDGTFDSIEENQYWGYWRSKVEGSYAGDSDNFDSWSSQWEQKGLEDASDPATENLRLYLSAEEHESYFSEGQFDGSVTGGWVDIEHAVTGIAVGKIHGEYDPSGASSDFSGASGGIWIETGILMTKLATANGRGDLEKLKIPNIEIGKATIAGSYTDGGGNQIDVTMTDVTFLARTAGATPRIWATDSVTGTYSGTPSTAWEVNLNQTAGTDAANVAAQFQLRTWDTGAGKWAATISNGTGTVGGKDIVFEGGGCGIIDNPAPGEISGTATGWSQ